MKQLGDQGEILAISYLQKHEYKILTTNFKFGRFGEIDIIAEKGEKTYFFEVKFRNSSFFGIPEESIIPSKLRKCQETLEYYCLKHRISLETVQFDVIAIEKKETSYQVRHYKNIALS